MDPRLIEFLFAAFGSGLALYMGAHLARRSSELSDRRRAGEEDRVRRQQERRDALLDRLALQRRALEEYTRRIVTWAAQGPPQGAAETAKVAELAADLEALAIFAQMASAFGNRKFAEQVSATVHAARAGLGDRQVFPFSLQIVSACCQEMVRAISELEKELGLPQPRSPARPFVADEDLAKEATRLFNRDMLAPTQAALHMVGDALERVRTSHGPSDLDDADVKPVSSLPEE